MREPRARRAPTCSARSLVAAIAAARAGHRQGPGLGLGRPRSLACFAVAAALVVAFVRRSPAHPAPVVEPALLRVRSFASANRASLLFFAGFGAMLLGSVLFMTESGTSRCCAPASCSRPARWRRPPWPSRPGAASAGSRAPALRRARLRAVRPRRLCGPADGGRPPTPVRCCPACCSGHRRRLHARAPLQRRRRRPPARPLRDRLGRLHDVPPARLRARRVLLVAVLGTPGSGDPVAAFDRGWVFIIIASGLGAVSALFIWRKRSTVEAPAAQNASARSRAAATAA